MKIRLLLLCVLAGTTPLMTGFAASAEQPAGTFSDRQQLTEMTAELRSLNGKANRLAEMTTSLRTLEQRLDNLLHSGWEYRFLARNRFGTIQAEIESLGKEGWELVAVTEEEGFVFKRRLARPAGIR